MKKLTLNELKIESFVTRKTNHKVGHSDGSYAQVLCKTCGCDPDTDFKKR